MTVSHMMIERAGEFELSVRVDDINIMGSPYSYLLRVIPSSLHGPSCVLFEIESEMYAGFIYDF